jgi:solute carrier family 45, member 1/2/4
MLGIGSVAGFFVYAASLRTAFLTQNESRGNLDLPRILPFLGSQQLEVLSVIASFLLLGTHVITAGTVKERVLVSSS